MGIWLCALTTHPEASLAADIHVIVGTQQLTWTYNGNKSTQNVALVVDDLDIGYIVEIQVPEGPIPHGFITITKNADEPAVESKELVLACGEEKSTKPNAVLEETNCGTASKFGVRFTGSMQLVVLDTFKDETDFWCVFHHALMQGELKLKQ
jgi:hypothetical protein